jgi:hypothetical protein
VPQTVDGKPLNLKLLGELIKKPLLGPVMQFRYFDLGEYTDPPNSVSHWSLLTREPIPGSMNPSFEVQKSFEVQQKLVNYRYKIPSALDVAVSACAEYVKKGNSLYSDWTLIRCPEMYNSNVRLVVGNFSKTGLYISSYYTNGRDHDEIHNGSVGIVCSLKFQ